MNKREQQEFSELEELLWRAEEALQEPEDYPDEIYLSDEEESDEYFPDEEYEDPAIYRNYANGYTQEAYQPRFHNPQYDRGVYPEEYREIPEDDYVMPEPKTSTQRKSKEKEKKKEKKEKKKRRGCGCGCLTGPLLLVLIAVVAMFVFIRPPRSEESIGSRKFDTATILVCGTDADGMRTDTMMLLYLSGSESRAGLLSLPRDTYTITASGKAAKLNSAYGRNGCGEEGMEVLMDYVQRIIGYRPDGYILVDFTLVPKIVDIMGGVDVDVPVLVDMGAEGMVIPAGYQHLTGEQVLAVLRFRSGYATADLGRIEVQRTVLKACLSQWLSPSHITGALEAISLLESGSTSSLTTSNYLWMAKALLLGMGDFRSDTLPGYAEYRDGASYYILDRSKVAELINEAYNPYKVTIDSSDLNIAN